MGHTKSLRTGNGTRALTSVSSSTLKVAVLLPCYNEQLSVGQVVEDLRAALVEWDPVIYVYDNNSTDNSVTVASAAGAVVRTERRQGKGHVIRQMFAGVEADVYVLMDSDGTYDAASAPLLIRELVARQLDMVVGSRLVAFEREAFPIGHELGNHMLTTAVRIFFGRQITDMLSGYRVFSKRYVKSFPALSTGFETETELTVHALRLRMPISEVQTRYGARKPGSASKLRTFHDGVRILATIVKLLQKERPFLFFSSIAAACALTSIALAMPILIEYLQTGLVPRLPTAVLATGLMIVGALSFLSGVILDTVTHGRNEIKRLFYLTIPPVSDAASPSFTARPISQAS